MIRLLMTALLALALLSSPSLAQKKDEAKKDAPAKVEPAKGLNVKVKSVDEKTNTLIVTLADGKSMTFKVEKTVSIVGPRGGKSEERLKDDRLEAGKEITLILAADGKTLKEIKLGVRRNTPEKDKKPVEKDKKPLEKDKKDK